MLFLMTNVSAVTTTTTDTEGFETDTHGANPDDTWYTYGELGWDWANVDSNMALPHDGSQTYLINDTDGGNISTDKSSFNFTSRTYDYFSFWFKWDNSSHNQSYGLLDSTDGYLLNIDFGNDAETLKVYNYTTDGIVRVLTNWTWYKLRFDFNYTDNTVRCRLYSATDVLLNDTWLVTEQETGTTDFDDFISFINFGATDDKVNLFFDDLSLSYQTTYTQRLRDDSNLDASQLLLVVMIGIMLCLVIVFMALEIANGKPDIKRLLGMVIAVIILALALGFI